jgi:hypothetical protein
MQNEINVPVFKISCHAIGQIMTESRGKSVDQLIEELEADIIARQEKVNGMKDTLKSYPKAVEMLADKRKALADLLPRKGQPNLSETCVSYLHKWADKHIYQRRAGFTSKQTDKGLLVEDDAINYAAIHLGWGFISKNLDRFHNDFMEGEPDVILGDQIPDIKASYTHQTFPLYDPELPTSGYAWQSLGYQILLGKQKGSIVYVLMSMPEEMIEKEAKWKLPQGYSQEEYETFAAQFRYDDFPPYLRIKEYEIPYDEDRALAIEKRVLECRHYIDTVILPEVEKNFLKFQKNDEKV